MVVHLIPRRGDPDAGRRSFEVPPATFNFHHCNAYETADGKVVADRRARRPRRRRAGAPASGRCLRFLALLRD